MFSELSCTSSQARILSHPYSSLPTARLEKYKSDLWNRNSKRLYFDKYDPGRKYEDTVTWWLTWCQSKTGLQRISQCSRLPRTVTVSHLAFDIRLLWTNAGAAFKFYKIRLVEKKESLIWGINLHRILPSWSCARAVSRFCEIVSPVISLIHANIWISSFLECFPCSWMDAHQ